MFATKPAQVLHRLFAAYHEPAPISAQQTQKLLDALKTSFRSQLDLEYGTSSDTSIPRPDSSKALQPRRRPAAKEHLKSILSNPLFSYVPDDAPAKRDPMDVFDHGVSKGMMTLRAATGVMLTKRNQLLDSGRPDAIASSQTARRVLRWLRASGAENDMAFLDNQPFLRELMPFLVAEDLTHVAWSWVDRIRGFGAVDTQGKRLSELLSLLVAAQTRSYYGDIDAGISTIQQAEKLLPGHAGVLVQPWKTASWSATIGAHTKAPPSPSLFEAHIATGERLPESLVVQTAHLYLHHPTKHDERPAMDLFDNTRELRQIVADANDALARKTAFKTVGWLMHLGSDTITHLMVQKRQQEAAKLSELLRLELLHPFWGAKTDTPLLR